jgi:hypothetical protein
VANDHQQKQSGELLKFLSDNPFSVYVQIVTGASEWPSGKQTGIYEKAKSGVIWVRHMTAFGQGI